MKKTILVFKNEFINVVFRRSFIIMLILMPLIPFVIYIFATASTGEASADNPLSQILAAPVESLPAGYVDYSEIIQGLPSDLPEMKRFASEQEALEALQAGTIREYYVVADDFIRTGQVSLIRPDFNPIGGLSNTDEIKRVMAYNLLQADAQIYERVSLPMQVKMDIRSAEPARDSDHFLTFMVPYAVSIIYYVVIMGAASLMLNSITSEKQNRVLEVLMTSTTPIQLLAGKIVALGMVGLLQTVVWSGLGLLLLRISGRTMNMPEVFQLPLSILIWGIVFFLLGYTVYASLMAGLGALVPNIREASQVTLMIMIPLIAPMVLISALVQSPNGIIALVLSFFPLTAPVAMMTRLAATTLPVWQPLLSAALVAGTAVLAVRSAAGMFRAQNLLSGQSFNLKLFLRALIGRS